MAFSRPDDAVDVNGTLGVVVVDDAADVRFMLAAYLRTHGLQVLDEGETARAAVVLAMAHHPDVIVLDVSMPGSRGIDAVALIKRASPATLVVMYTGDATGEGEAAAWAAGADAYLSKTVGPAELVDVVIDLTGHRRGHAVRR